MYSVNGFALCGALLLAAVLTSLAFCVHFAGFARCCATRFSHASLAVVPLLCCWLTAMLAVLTFVLASLAAVLALLVLLCSLCSRAHRARCCAGACCRLPCCRSLRSTVCSLRSQLCLLCSLLCSYRCSLRSLLWSLAAVFALLTRFASLAVYRYSLRLLLCSRML